MITFDNEITNILIFKTNLKFKKDLEKISKRIGEESRIKTWNVDMEDIDKVLRIKSVNIEAEEIIKMVEHAGYLCEELPD